MINLLKEKKKNIIVDRGSRDTKNYKSIRQIILIDLLNRLLYLFGFSYRCYLGR